MNPEEIRELVRGRYGAIAAGAADSCCAPKAEIKTSCCGGAPLPETPSAAELARRMGYDAAEVAAGEGANLGLGCGNPGAIAALKPGETVVDLGSGAGFDCFLAARKVGETGRVIGIDMTPEMLKKARANAAKLDLSNVEFRLGEIEHLPLADAAADAVISNCVINLSPDKAQVFREALRVLKPGGRLAVADVVALKPLPAAQAENPDLMCGCIGGALPAEEIRRLLAEAGFADIRVEIKAESRDLVKEWAPEMGVEDYVASASIEAVKPKPKRACCG